MGYIAHNAVICTTWKKEHAAEAHLKAVEIFTGDRVTEIIETKLNGYFTFFVAPDGSKEGWEHSEHGDRLRNQFMDFCKESRLYLDAVDVRYGGDEPDKARIERKNETR